MVMAMALASLLVSGCAGAGDALDTAGDIARVAQGVEQAAKLANKIGQGAAALTCGLLSSENARVESGRFHPVLVAETGAACALETFEARLEAEISAGGGSITSERAQRLSDSLSAKTQVLALGRIAYDAARRFTAPATEVAQIDAARARTDAAFGRAQRRLASFFAPPI
jgi:hypothetical protein